MDLRGQRRRASREATLAVLRALGAPVDRASDIPEAIRERREEGWGQLLEPVAVVWEGLTAAFDLRMPPGVEPTFVELRLELEGGGSVRGWKERVEDLVPLPPEPEASGLGVRRRVVLSDPLPLGYHRLWASAGGRQASCLVISAPRRTDPSPDPGTWGVFLPLYALWSKRSWGVGDLTDLGALRDWVVGLGGRLVGTLPMFAAFLRDPGEPSPYSPISRLFWNELFVDVEAAPELAANAEARRLISAPGTRRAIGRLRRRPLVDHAQAAALKRSVLELLTDRLHRSGSRRRDALEEFAREHPALDDYARFRAAGERWGVNWRVWPGPARDGRLETANVDSAATRFHRYAQFLADEQMGELRRVSEEGGAGLYLDMPLGVHPDGYDVWRERESFAQGVSAGAPPDDFFQGGQDWGFPPPHPDRIREEGYRYQIACLRRAMAHAAALRIDHVMGLHRLYWVPEGASAEQGLYVRYRPEEWYAIVALESRRSGTAIVGEDLGTVPPAVRASMDRHGLLRSYVLQMEAGPDGLRPPPARSLATLNTHDMPPFAAWWDGTGGRTRSAVARDLRRLGFLVRGAERDEAAVLRACLAYLGRSPARIAIANLEDLWGEHEPQNRPGSTGYPSWRRRAAHPLEELPRLPEVADTLAEVGVLRRQRGAPSRRGAGGIT